MTNGRPLNNAELDEIAIANDRERELEVSPPGQPMPNVRRFLAAKYHHAQHQLLVHQGGQFYAHDGKCWLPIEDVILQSRLYRWFEVALVYRRHPKESDAEAVCTYKA
jgi:hypothetical protein